jgi:hypothetical protein
MGARDASTREPHATDEVYLMLSLNFLAKDLARNDLLRRVPVAGVVAPGLPKGGQLGSLQRVTPLLKVGALENP